MPRPSGLILPGDPLFNLKQENRIKELAFREARRVVERYGGGGSFSLTVAEEDGSPSVSGVDTIKFTNGSVTDNGDDSVSVNVSGGGSTPDGSIWSPDAPPASAGSADDEFADASGGLPVGWAEFDPDSIQAVSENEYGLSLVQTSTAGIDITGVYKTIPAGDFTIWAKVSLLSIIPGSSTFAWIGLALWEDATGTTGDIWTINYQVGPTEQAMQVTRWSDYQTFSTRPVAINDDWQHTGLYLRIRRTASSSTYAFDFSTDGIGWRRAHSTSSLGFTPSHFGIAVNNENTGADIRGVASFFRYLASDVGTTGIVSGDRISFFRS